MSYEVSLSHEAHRALTAFEIAAIPSEGLVRTDDDGALLLVTLPTGREIVCKIIGNQPINGKPHYFIVPTAMERVKGTPVAL